MRTPLRLLSAVLAVGILGAAPGGPAGLRDAVGLAQGTPAPPPGQQAVPPPNDPQQPPPRIRTGINYVSVDVIVTDKDGQPVLDMKQEDFSVAEDGKPQKVDAFTLIKVDGLATVDEGPPRAIKDDLDEEREAARPEVRLFVILFDDYHVARGSDMSVRKPLIDFIQNQLAPADMVAIMYPLTPVTDLRFTRDRGGIIAAVDRLEGRKFDYRPRNSFEAQYSEYPAATVERIRNQITMSALEAAAVKMGGLREGRKSIIFVSEGFTAMLPAQLADPVASMPGVGNPNRGQTVVPQATDMQQLVARTDLLSDMQHMWAMVNRQNTSIYCVDPRGLAVFQYDVNVGVGLTEDAAGLRASLDTLHEIASNTDGRAIVNRNDLASGMKQIMRDASGYYLLGYNSTQAPTDGKFHAIKVSVKRKGVDVRARKGYWAYTLDDVARANATASAPEVTSAVTNALNELVAPVRDRSAHFWIGTSRGDKNLTRVSFLWEPATVVPGQRQDEPPARVSLTAVVDGRPVFRGRVPDEPAAAAAPGAASARAGGATAFDVPPGHVELRMVVEGKGGQVLDSVARDLTVPDYGTATVSFGTPRVYVARTIPELQSLKSKLDAVPTSDREFSRNERVYIRADAYAPGGVTPTVTARLLNRTGKGMSDLPVQIAPGRPAEIELALSPFAAGEYLIELKATTPAGVAQELIAFRVGR